MSGLMNAESDGDCSSFQKGLSRPYLKKADISGKNILVGRNEK